MHIPVLVDKVIEFLKIQNNKIYVDATVGCGGYVEKILNLCPSCKVIAIDWDEKAIDYIKYKFSNFIENKSLIIIKDNFINIKEIIKRLNLSHIDGAIFDFGLSTLQIKSNRGFSFYDSNLDMRMSSEFSSITAYEIVNKFNEKDLADIFFKYGEEKFSKFLAKIIVEKRKKKKIESAKELSNIVLDFKRFKIKKKIFHKNSVGEIKFKFHPATKLFQALRIFINKELENIEIGLNNTIDILSPSSRLVAISYHSLEDRIVKNIFKNRSDCKVLTKKPILPLIDEVSVNRSSRSAKLRVVEKL